MVSDHSDRHFSKWLQHSRTAHNTPTRSTRFSIAIQSPCIICQPRISTDLASYLNEFDEASDGSNWISVNDILFEQIQTNQDFRYILGPHKAGDNRSSIIFLSTQGYVILEMASCHEHTADCENVFQVSLNCKEPTNSNHHLWLNAKRIPIDTLVPMIANSFIDWVSKGGDLKSDNHS